jgi:hypothetical protein
MANIAILTQMGGSNGFATARNHLIEGTAVTEFRIELAAEFAEAAGAYVEAMDDGWVNVFHGDALLDKRGRRPIRPVVRLGHKTPPRVMVCSMMARLLTTPFYYRRKRLTSPS